MRVTGGAWVAAVVTAVVAAIHAGREAEVHFAAGLIGSTLLAILAFSIADPDTDSDGDSGG
jgi:hypothetical protein